MKKKYLTQKKKRSGKGIWILLLVVFTLVAVADIANLFLTPARSFEPGGFPMGMEGEMPSFGSGERPSFEDGQLPSFERGPGGNRRGGILQTIRSVGLPVLVICILGDAICLIALLRLRRKKKAAEEAFDGMPLLEEEEDEPPKRKRGPWGTVLCLMIAMALILTMIPTEDTDASSANVHQQVLFGTAEAGKIDTVLSGAGTLEADSMTPVTVPQQVTVLKYHVRNGETVSAGDSLVSVDKTSAASAMMDLYDVLDDLDDDLEAQRQASNASHIYSTAAGRVKKIYASPGDTVTDVLYEHGALMLLSLDGTMRVTFESEESLYVGQEVTVKYSAIQEEGRIISVREGRVTVTLSDENAWYGAEASILDEDGNTIGQGKIEINSALKVIGYYGKVDGISVSVGDKVSVGTTLLTLKDTGFTTDYQILLARRNELEAQMQQLSQLARTGMVTAEKDGIVSGVPDDAEIELLSASGGWKLVLLSGEGTEDEPDPMDAETEIPDGGTGDEPQTSLSGYYAARLLAATGDELVLQLRPEALDDTASVDLGTLKAEMTDYGVYSFNFSGDPITLYINKEKNENATLNDLKADDLLVVYLDDAGVVQTIAWAERTVKEEKPENPGEGMPGGFGGGMPSGGGGFSGGMPSSGSATQQESYDQYIVEESELLYVSDQDEISLTFPADELDVLAVKKGLAAQITLDAMKGQSFPGEVVRISSEGTSDGGNAKFDITVTGPRDGNMLDGMNASVKVVTGSREAAVTIPAAALVEKDGKTHVYTTYDEETDTLGTLVEVTTGASDGERVEILSGMEAGDTYYYRYADTVTYRFL